MFKFLLVLLLSSCGYESGDLDRGLECIDGCSDQQPDATATPVSCSAQQASNGAILTCSDGTNAIITNGINGLDGSAGRDGIDGRDATSAYVFTEIVDPCGEQAMFDEVLFKMANGQVLALYYSKKQSFLTVVDPGVYTTTDGTECTFTVHADGKVTW